ncbi:MAG TPA: cupin domain-containing protein [Acidimicrobiales bacterium]|jgi:quercetin dioxygenase-like cupin family protein|nr:cupin domain-containing protein [Acidimicrobiales bacterium]
MPHRIVYVAAGDGAQLSTVDSIATVKISADDTADAYELFEIIAPPGPGVPPHRHPWAEAYYVLDGELDVRVGARELVLGPRDTVTVPPNAVHTIASRRGDTRFLAFSLTNGTGALFADLDRGVPAARPIEEIAPLIVEIAARHKTTFVGPPAP